MSSNLPQKHRQFFQAPLCAFALIGIDPSAGNSGAIIKRPLICYGLFASIVIFVCASVDFCIKNVHNVDDFTLTVSLLNQLLIVVWKIAIFLVKRQRINKLISDIWQWNEKADSDEFQIVSSGGRKNALLSKLYYLVIFVTGVMGLSLPFVIKLLQITDGQERVLELPHKASFFWSTTNFVGYTAAYTWNIIVIYFVINASVGVDTLFLWFVSNILIYFRILKRRFEQAATNRRTHQDLFRNFISTTVQYHLRILYLAKEFDSIFGEIIFVKSLISCTQICFLAFCLLNQKSTSALNLLHPSLFLMAVSLQLILYCYNGHLMEEQSHLVSKNVFAAFDWSALTVCNQKMLQMIMMRSQKSSPITGIFFNLNLGLYLWFFKTAASLIAVLRNLEGGT